MLFLRSYTKTHLTIIRIVSVPRWNIKRSFHTEVVPEGQVQQSEQSTELYQLSLHALHLLLKVMVLKVTKTHQSEQTHTSLPVRNVQRNY